MLLTIKELAQERSRMEVASTDISKQSQDLVLRQLIQYGKPTRSTSYRLQIYIRSNAYKDQCECVIKVWTPNGWTELWRIDPGSMVTEPGLYVQASKLGVDAIGEFALDRDCLLGMAVRILGPLPGGTLDADEED